MFKKQISINVLKMLEMGTQYIVNQNNMVGLDKSVPYIGSDHKGTK